MELGIQINLEGVDDRIINNLVRTCTVYEWEGKYYSDNPNIHYILMATLGRIV